MNNPFNPQNETCPMNNVNLNTRPRYDIISSNNRTIITQQPMQYITEPTSIYRNYIEPAPEDIGVSNDLRICLLYTSDAADE